MYSFHKKYWCHLLDAGHIIDLPYVFGTTSTFMSVAGYGTHVRQLTETVTGAWARFAISGDPGLIGWAPWDPVDGWMDSLSLEGKPFGS